MPVALGIHHAMRMRHIVISGLSSSKIFFRISEMLRLEHGSVWCWNLDAPGNRSEKPGKFWNVVLEKDGEDQLDRPCEKWRSVTSSQWAEEYPTWNKKTEG